MAGLEALGALLTASEATPWPIYCDTGARPNAQPPPSQ